MCTRNVCALLHRFFILALAFGLVDFALVAAVSTASSRFALTPRP